MHQPFALRSILIEEVKRTKSENCELLVVSVDQCTDPV